MLKIVTHINVTVGILFVCLFGLIFKVPVNSYGHVRTVSHLTTLFPGQVNQYFVHILSLVIDNNPS